MNSDNSNSSAIRSILFSLSQQCRTVRLILCGYKRILWPLYFLNGCKNWVLRVGLVFLTVPCVKVLRLWCHLKMVKALGGGDKSEVFLGKGYWDLSLHLSPCLGELLDLLWTFCHYVLPSYWLWRNRCNSFQVDCLIFCYNVRELRAGWIEWNNMRAFELDFWSVKSISNLSLLLKRSVFYSPSLIVGKYIILWIPQAALSINCWSVLLSVWENGVSSCTERF